VAIISSVIPSRLIRLQLGQEVTWGTAVAATSILNGLDKLPTITPQVKDTIFDEQRGSLAPSYSSAQVMTGAQFDLSGYVTFEDILYILNGVYGKITPTGTGPYVWTALIPSTATFTPVAYTMELGDLGVATGVKLTGGLIQQWTIAGTQQKEMTFTAKGFGQAAVFGITPTAALAYRTTEIALTPETAMYMDPAGTAPGTTIYSGQLIDFTLTGDSGLVPFYAGGSKGPVTFTYAKQQTSLKVSLAYSAALDAALQANLLAGKTAIFQLKTTSGAKSIVINFSGALKSDPQYFGDSQGAQMVSLEMDAVYDATDAMYTGITVTNNVATLP
jgi:hypothetical protein